MVNRPGSAGPGERLVSGEVRGPHVDLGAQRQRGCPLIVVQNEQDPLPLTEHAKHRALERAVGEVELGEVGIPDNDTVAGSRVVGLDDSLHCGVLVRPTSGRP